MYYVYTLCSSDPDWLFLTVLTEWESLLAYTWWQKQIHFPKQDKKGQALEPAKLPIQWYGASVHMDGINDRFMKLGHSCPSKDKVKNENATICLPLLHLKACLNTVFLLLLNIYCIKKYFGQNIIDWGCSQRSLCKWLVQLTRVAYKKFFTYFICSWCWLWAVLKRFSSGGRLITNWL